ncbi:hypothetical protein FDP41_008031 [Naegleria fowleri]|uniref:Uncharacterized protein n=1 Tax=Naegleria fowleri TaxID=5763 RepID=A0A6A5C8N0_NAEFO|nr:uncharacterized protein FDP41_008031 [Naegleria fowleri]KAF0984116.1 hypothetical protein FDP41_008031 [Naegleria fowleri]
MQNQPSSSSIPSSSSTNNNTNNVSSSLSSSSSTTRPSPIPNSPNTLTTSSSSSSNMMMRSSPKPSSGGMIPQYQQYFHLLQSISSGGPLPIPSTSTSLNGSGGTSNLPFSPNLNGLPPSSSASLVSTSPMMRRTTLSAILGTTPSGLTRSSNNNSSNSVVGSSTSSSSSNQNSSSSASSKGNTSPKNEQSSTTPMLVTTSANQNSTQIASPVPISSVLPVKLSHDSHHDSSVVLDSSVSMPSPAVAKQKKSRKKKEEKEEKNSANEDDATSSGGGGGQGEDEQSKKGRSKTCKRWTEEQNRLLKDAVLRYGPRNWKKIASEISGGMFTADQCNQHWHRVLHPRIIKGEWTQEEDNLLFDKVAEYGESSWTKVAEFLIGRTDIQCRHRYFQKKKEMESGSRRKTTSTFSSPSLASSTGVSPGLGVTADGGLLSPQLAGLEGVRVNVPNPSPPLGISPSSILDSASTSNFVHQHKITLFTTPSTVPLQERLKGDSSVILGQQPSPNIQNNTPSGTFASPSLSMESKQRVTQFSYLEKEGIDESDFVTIDEMPMIVPTTTTTPTQFPKSQQTSTPQEEKKIPTQQKQQAQYNENLLLCDEEDLSTPQLGATSLTTEEDMSSATLMKRATPQLATPQMGGEQDDMDEDDEPHQLTIDEMDTVSPELSKAKNLQMGTKSTQPLMAPVHTTIGSPQVATTISSGSDSLSSSANINNTPTITPAKPKKRSSALNRMRGNINVWIPFSESEEQVLITEVYKQILEKNLPLPHINMHRGIQSTAIVGVSISEDQSSSIQFQSTIPNSSESTTIPEAFSTTSSNVGDTNSTSNRQSILLPSPVPVLTSNSPLPRQLIPHNNNIRKTSVTPTTSVTSSDYVDDIDFVEILTVNSNCFHPLRTHHSLKTHFVKLREMLGDAALFNLSHNHQGPLVLEPLSQTPLALYQKSNSHAWLSSSKVATHRTSSSSLASSSHATSTTTSTTLNSASSSSQTTPNKPGRKKKIIPQDVTKMEEGVSANASSSTAGKPGRKRKTASAQIPGVASSTMAEPTRKKVKKTLSEQQKNSKSEDQMDVNSTQSTNQLPLVGDSNVTFLLLKNFNAPPTTKQIQPSKMTLPLDTPLSQIVSTIRGNLSLNYDPEIICENSPISNTSQSLRNLMDEKNIQIDELVLFYK